MNSKRMADALEKIGRTYCKGTESDLGAAAPIRKVYLISPEGAAVPISKGY